MTTAEKTLPRLKQRYRDEIKDALNKRVQATPTSCRSPAWSR